MGKRRERRLAAMSATGRRVKLDLFAEPSGDMGGSSVHEEVGGELDSKRGAGLPNSPSSSGQKPENPLLLLGQYSDDELDEESNKRLDNAIVNNSPVDHNDQVNEPVVQECEDVEVNAGEDLTAQEVNQQDMERDSASLDVSQDLEGNNIRQSDASGDLSKDMDSTKQISPPGTSNIQVIGDVSSGWKIVMHEASNGYYYWNIETGETSWEVPDVLAQGTELTDEQKMSHVMEGRVNFPTVAHESSSSLDGDLDGSSAMRAIDGSIDECEVAEQNEGSRDELLVDKNWGSDVNPSESKSSSDAVNAFYRETSSLGNYLSFQQSSDALLGNKSSTRAGSECIHDRIANGEHETSADRSSHLVKYGEYLLERLESLKGSKGHLQGQDWMSKYILEVEIRLSDLRSLLSYGSSLLPFWVHSERQFKRLEEAINDEVYQLDVSADSAQMNEVEAAHVSFLRDEDKSRGIMGEESEADGNEKKVVFSTENCNAASPISNTLTIVQKDSRSEATNSDVVNAEHVSSFGYDTKHLSSGTEGKSDEVYGTMLHDELTPKPGLHAGEDVDMDVDMEVEDAIPASTTIVEDALGAKYFAPLEQPVQPNLIVEDPSLALEDDVSVPPPPDEEWIPPPPPDNELVPPPPPDEPPELSYPPPPSYPDMAQPLSYTEQYNLSYPSSNFVYYGHTLTEVPNRNFYGNAEGCQVVVPHPPLYYEAVSNTYSDNTPVIVNPAEPVAYYDLQDGNIPPVPVVGSVESSGLQTESGPVSYNIVASDQNGFVDAPAEEGCSSLPNTNVDVATFGGETEVTSTVDPFTSAPVQAPSTKESVPVPSTNVVTTAVAAAAAAAAASAVTKVQSKVSRNKKRTNAVAPTLRSNKKVSSLVDKWMAAKEELHEDEEDEPENAYEALEKKRRREIEEWRAQQIASGEAKDNANFQPLGGDWRERLKRKRARAQLTKEAVQSSQEALTDINQEPDLIELSRDLPSGWQAYWDESSKQVYYGNAVTSETTWTKPTK